MPHDEGMSRDRSGSWGELGVDVECLLEEFLLPAGSPHFKLHFCTVCPAQMEMDRGACPMASETMNNGIMSAIEAVGNAEDRSEFNDNVPLFIVQLRVPLMPHFRMAFSVVPGDVCDDFFFILREPKELRVADKVV